VTPYDKGIADHGLRKQFCHNPYPVDFTEGSDWMEWRRGYLYAQNNRGRIRPVNEECNHRWENDTHIGMYVCARCGSIGGMAYG
jgi:hypothetical protein